MKRYKVETQKEGSVRYPGYGIVGNRVAAK